MRESRAGADAGRMPAVETALSTGVGGGLNEGVIGKMAKRSKSGVRRGLGAA
jgi:hypothetical protein